MSDMSRVFTSDTEEYGKLKAFCDRLNKVSPNKHVYIIKDIYMDYGADIMWSTIIDTTAGCQVLSPRDWDNIIYELESLDELEKDFFSDKYCQDKPLK